MRGSVFVAVMAVMLCHSWRIYQWPILGMPILLKKIYLKINNKNEIYLSGIAVAK
jgi:hypothetical protein